LHNNTVELPSLKEMKEKKKKNFPRETITSMSPPKIFDKKLEVGLFTSEKKHMSMSIIDENDFVL
jgi:hypothetical protein